MNTHDRTPPILLSWLAWHFWGMPKFLLSAWRNYLEFGLDFFSVPLLAMTLFSPWRRYYWIYPKANIAAYPGVFISNTFSRIIGALLRIGFIILGIIFQIIIFAVGLIIILGWLMLPFIFLGLLYLLFYVI